MVNNGSNSNNAAASATVLSDSGEPDVNAVVRDPSTILSGSGETILAREIAKLSTSEREAIMHDIHGVTDEEHFKETPALIAEKLTQLESKIQQLMQHQMRHNTNSNDAAADRPGNIGTAYSLALAMNPEYVQDASFRLMFLRASHFDVAQAAKRFLGHFEKKMELFGASKLVKTITLEDLDADDNECLLRGQSQLLPYRDRSGRAVFVQALSHYQYKQVVNAVSTIVRCVYGYLPFAFSASCNACLTIIFISFARKLRVIYFLLMCAVEDEETQKKGIVSVVYNVEPRTPVANDTRIYLNVYQLLPTLPIRMMGAHYCVQDSDLRRFMSSIRVAMSREVRLRSRVHHGSHQECIYTLMTFGVPRKCFPISDTGELLVEKHVEFLAMRRKQEAAASAMMHAIEDMNAAGRGVGNSNSSNHLSVPLQQQQHLIKRIIVPTNVDVLLGRGRPFQEHAGNMRCNFVVVAAMEEYEQVSRNDKTGVSRNVISKIKGYGGRFLKQNDGVWEEVDDAEALKKISHSFRTHRQLLKTHQESNSGVTSSKCKQLSSPVQNDSHSHKRQKD
ncbi:MAG: hypothetical protein SGILL_000903 [Bacillariaceae sp.]